MTRTSLLAASALVLVAAACHPPSLRDRAASLGGKFAALGQATVKMVAPAAPKLHINVEGVATAMARDQLQQRVASVEPIRIDRSVHRNTAPADEAPPPARQDDEPAIQVTHLDASKPDMFVLRGQTYGGKQICEAYTSMDQCTSTCTAELRVNAFTPRDQIDPSSTKDCSCIEQSGGC